MPGWLQELDEAVLIWIHQGWRAPWADAFFIWITDAAHFVIPLGVAWALLFIFGGRRGRVMALLLGVTLLLTDQLSSHVVKPWVDRTRPCFDVAGVEALIAQVHSRSFPSSHAANMFGAATILSLGAGGWWRMTYVLAFLVGLSRIYVGVHYPTDVLAGAVLGVIVGLTIWTLAEALGLMRPRPTAQPGPSSARRTRGGARSRGGDRR
jgi:undecaprenyl-diphosphatase